MARVHYHIDKMTREMSSVVCQSTGWRRFSDQITGAAPGFDRGQRSVLAPSKCNSAILPFHSSSKNRIAPLPFEKPRGRRKMRENRKRKFNPAFAAAVSTEPYPNFHRPTPEECRFIRDDLLSLHGFPQEFARFRRNNHSDVDANPPNISSNPDQSSNPSKLREDDEKRTALSLLGTVSLETREESILDGLVSTLLSQNTTDSNSRRAFASLKSAFPTWEDVLAAETECVVDAIRCGGLANTKASCIKNILSSLLEKRGKLCLEYLRGMPVDAIKAELRGFKGIGPKTVACVLMFHLQQDDFPVDTHVFRIAKAIGWVPSDADRERAHLHLNNRIPDNLKFELNCLLFTHGKICQRCAKKGRSHQRRASHDACPLSSYCCGTD